MPDCIEPRVRKSPEYAKRKYRKQCVIRHDKECISLMAQLADEKPAGWEYAIARLKSSSWFRTSITKEQILDPYKKADGTLFTSERENGMHYWCQRRYHKNLRLLFIG